MTRKTIIGMLLLLVLPSTAFCADDQANDTAATQDIPFDDDEFPLFDESDFVNVYDPLEPINRGIFWFNDKLYFYALKPVARGWRYAPEPLRISLKHFFQNLQAPVHIVNAGLQGKFSAAGTELTRFATNTTLGIGGLFDPAKEHFGQHPQVEDTGQTLGFYGIGAGPFLVLPFIGPSNLRDGLAGIADTQLDIAWYLWGHDKDSDNYDYLGARAADAVNIVSLDKDTYEGIKRDALDPYLFMRDAYAQFRHNQISQ